MLISHSKKFIFIHIYKVAGTSIGSALARYCDFSAKYKNPLKRISVAIGKRHAIYSKSYKAHISAQELKETIPEFIFNNYFKFAFVRNPFDWQVSLYEYARQNIMHPQHDLTLGFKSFDAYIEWRVDGNYQCQKDFVFSHSGKLLVDFIGKLENLEDDMNKIYNAIGIKKICLPHKNASKRADYRSYYSSYSKELVEKTFADDINLFGYSF